MSIVKHRRDNPADVDSNNSDSETSSDSNVDDYYNRFVIVEERPLPRTGNFTQPPPDDSSDEDDISEESDDEFPVQGPIFLHPDNLLRQLKQWAVDYTGIHVDTVPANWRQFDIYPLLPQEEISSHEFAADYPFNQMARVNVTIHATWITTGQRIREYVPQSNSYRFFTEFIEFSNTTDLLIHLSRIYEHFHNQVRPPTEPRSMAFAGPSRPFTGPSADEMDA